MGYLKCDKCDGYYKLQEGESPEDFVSCECGGKLRSVKDSLTKNHEIVKNQINYCSNCGSKIKYNSNFCKNCGMQIINQSNINPNEKICSNCGSINDNDKSFCKECGTNLGTINNKVKKLVENGFIKNDNINWIGILLGSIVGLIMIFSFSSSPSFIPIYILSLVIGGFIASFIGGGKYKIALKYGLIIALTFVILLVLNEMLLGGGFNLIPPGIYPEFGLIPLILSLFLFFIMFILVFIFSTIIGIIGALIGILVNKILNFDFNKFKRKAEKR